VIDLETVWTMHWGLLRLPAPMTLLSGIVARWDEPHRRYHSLQHLRECLALFEQYRALAEHPGEVAIALWFHDAVYETHGHENEALSAAWAARALTEAGAPGDVGARVHELIMATRHDGAATTDDARLLVDIDLAILGAAPARFAEYERQIRDEYAHVPEPRFRAKRAEILRGFLAREPLFSTQAFAARFELAAKSNLAQRLPGLVRQSR
jgi:predicted metal-dependent HD superfamily phosphohydrolase